MQALNHLPYALRRRPNWASGFRKLVVRGLHGAVLAVCLLAGQAVALELPGLEEDAQAYARELKQRAPAGATPQARRQADTRVADAQRRNDQAALATALEARIPLGEPTSDQWLTLARAQLRKTPADANRALRAAWLAFGLAESGAPEIPPLLVVAEALRVLDRPAQAIQALEAVVERAPDDAGYKQQLADARRAAGMLVKTVRPEPEADPPRACIEFTSAPSRHRDFVPGDWVRFDPPGQIAVTREGDQLCLSGLRLGATTRVTLRAGMPGEDGLRLNKEAVLPVAMGNRAPKLMLDGRLFVLPRRQTPRITLASVNLSSVKLKLLRVGERNVVPWVRNNRLGTDLEQYALSDDDSARTVWEGQAAIPGYRQNEIVRTALPVPDAFPDPGIYVLTVRPGDGTTGDVFAAQVIVRTDLAPTVWRGSDGLTAQVRSLSDAAPRGGVRLSLLSRGNDVLAQATTDGDGVARFGAPLLAGEGSQAPAEISAFLDDDYATLDLTTAAFDLSDRGVEGLPSPGPLDAYAWTDRGIYRPGETVNLSALLRDAAGQPADVPARVRVKRPNGQVFLQTVPPRGGDASLTLPIPLSATAPAGAWTAEILVDPKRPPIGTASFRVDAFVPDRMAVELEPQGDLVAGQPYKLPVTARYLYGAPGAGLIGKGTLRLVASGDPPPALTGYRVGLAGEEFAPDAQEIELPATDAQGRSTLPILLPRAPDSTRPVRAELDVEINDPSGRGVHARTTVPVRPAGNLIGIKPGFDEAVDAGAEAVFEVAAVRPDGVRTAMRATLRLVRERPDWRRVTRGGTARYEMVIRDEPLETQDVQIPASGTLRYAKRLDFGRYRIEVVEAGGGLAATSVRFRSGWVGSDSPDVPDKVDVSADRRQYRVGETARVHVVAPFAGKATLLVVSDRVHLVRDIDLPAGGTDLDVAAGAAWGPGAYALVHAFRGGSGDERPARAIGLAWLGLDPGARRLDVSAALPDRVAPRQRITVPVRTAPGAWVSVAAVDEGILRLTSFASPDPAAHFLGRRRLGLDIRDDWGRLIRPGEGDATALRQGGDDDSGALPEIPQRTVSLFVPPVQAGADGQAAIPLDLPDFNGQVRLMVVSWQGNKVGSVSAPLVVRDGIVAEALLPRFLAPGDEIRLPVLLHNVDLGSGEVAAELRVDGPLALTGPARLAATLANGAQAIQAIGLRGTGSGRGVISMVVTGPGGFRVERETAILVRPVRPAISLVSGGEIAPGAEARLMPAVDRLVPGTWSSSARFGGPVRYDVAALVRALQEYPLNCLEQAVSRALPLALLPDGPAAGDDRAGRLQAAIAQVLDRQRYDGAFALWSGSGEAEEWLSAYATDFLLRARDAGAAVPEAALADALKYLAEAVERDVDTPEARATQAYRLLVLAQAGQARVGAARMLAEDPDKLPTPLARAQLAASLARSNETARAEALMASAVSAPARKEWGADYGTALRDQVAVALLMKESGLLSDRFARVVAALPGADLVPDRISTQEQAWAAAAGAVLGRDGRPTRVSLDGRTLGPAPVLQVALSGPAVARNLDDRAVWQTVSATGVPRDPPAAARNAMRITRRFYTTTGDTLDLDKLRQATSFIVLLEGRADDGQGHRVAVLQGLPAGWEIAGRFGGGVPPGLGWLGELTEAEAQPAADDRFAAVVGVTTEQPAFRVAVRLRAVTAGDFELPGALAADMYRPVLFARQNTNRIKVQPAE